MCHSLFVLNFVLAPFIVQFIIIYFFIKNAERFHKDPMQLGNRQWSQYALWRSAHEQPSSGTCLSALWLGLLDLAVHCFALHSVSCASSTSCHTCSTSASARRASLLTSTCGSFRRTSLPEASPTMVALAANLSKPHPAGDCFNRWLVF